MIPTRVAVFLLLLFGVIFPTFSCISNATDVVLSEQGTLIWVVIMLTVVVIACAYVAGSVLTNANYTVFAKDELYHLGFSVAILVGFSSLVLLSCNVADLFYTSFFHNIEGSLQGDCFNENSMQATASCYMGLVKGDATSLSKSYIKNYLDKLMDSTFAWSIQLPLVNSYTSTAGAYKRIISNQYDLILNSFLVPALMSVSMQKIVLDFIRENIIQWILPAAFVLRVFIPTRQMGNILIALALGLYILVPFMYVFNFAMYDASNSSEDCQNMKDAVCDNAVDGSCSSPAQACSNPNSFWNVGRLIPVAFFLPNLTIVILITFLSCMHKALRVIG